MSGGFFRGTSADQDTRFSNKQAKLLKSQKFAPELDHVVDMTRVKMDVIRPWIATRATEFLGFEDEVLINFVYGLLDGKEVDGKQIQIQLTGFMEKNTGKFMKELWSLLLSAQNNVSGVPQQFLDAKEEETRKKKEETDKITLEIQKRREREGRQNRFDGETDISRASKGASDQVPNTRDSSFPPEEREADERHGSRAKNGRSRSPHPNKHSPSPYRRSRSPHPNKHSPSPYRITPSPTRSNNKSISRSRSRSEERRKSRSASVSSQSTNHSISPKRQYRSPARRSPSPDMQYRSSKRSISPRWRRSPRTRSPSRRRSPFSRRRSRSRSRHRSPSPFRHRSPRRRRSPQYIHRRLPSPPRRRSRTPPRRRSPSPIRRRSPSPQRRRSPSPRRRSPVRARRRTPSPLRRRSPIRRRSVSPVRHRSPPSLKRRSPLPRSPKHQRRSPLCSPRNRNADSQISPRQRNRSSSPDRSRSPSYQTRRSLSRERDSRIDGPESRRMREKRSPANHATGRESDEHPGSGRKDLGNVSNRVPISVRSPQRDMGTQSEDRSKAPVVPSEDSSSESESPTHVRKINLRTSRRSRSLSRSPGKQTMARMPRHDSPRASREVEQTGRVREALRQPTDSSHRRTEGSPRDMGSKRPRANNVSPEMYSPDRVAARDQSPPVSGRPELLEERKKFSGHRSDMNPSERHAQQHSGSSEEIEYGPGRINKERGSLCNADARRSKSVEKRECNEQTVKSSIGDGYGVHKKKQSRAKDDDYNESQHEIEFTTRSKKKVDKRNQLQEKYSDSEETDSYSQKNAEKRRHKKSDKRKRDSDLSSEYDSQMDDKKEAKRRRKDEKRLRKEEKRRRREERHRRRLERRAGKQKVKSMDTVTPPSDFEKNHTVADDSDGDPARRKNSIPSDTDESETEQKKLEIELREKALESLRAKKAISH